MDENSLLRLPRRWNENDVLEGLYDAAAQLCMQFQDLS